MNRSLSLLSAFALCSVGLLSLQPQEAKAIEIAFDCFERSSEKLVARSAVDITSTSISCLPVPGTTLTDDSSDDSDSDILVDNTDTDEGIAYEDEELAYEDEDVSAEDEGDTNPVPSPGSELGGALGKQLGNLLEKGLNDLFR